MFNDLWTRRSCRNAGSGSPAKGKIQIEEKEPGKKDGYGSAAPQLSVCNILVLGKTGAGKTSLLNYLYGFDLPVGAGLPKTGRGLHENVLVRDGVSYHVYDTWGIEANALPEWRKEIMELVQKRNTSPYISHWFHAVYYCFSANTARIEEAEVEQVILPLLRSGCKVIIVLTNAEDGYRKAEKLQGMKDYLQERLTGRLGEAAFPPVIPVASVAGETLSGDPIVRFGRTEILKAARYHLAEDIEKRLPAIYRENVKMKLSAWRERSLLLLAKGKISFVLNNNSARQLIDLINYDLANTFGAIDADGDRLEAEANAYLAGLPDRGPLPKAWRPGFQRITYVTGYEYTKGFSAGLLLDVAAGLLRSSKSIREDLSRRVEKTCSAILDGM